MPHTHIHVAAIFLAILAACAVQPLKYGTAPVFTVLEPPKGPEPVFNGWSRDEQAKLQKAIKVTEEVVRSEPFQRRLVSVTNLYDRTRGQLVRPDSLLKTYIHKRLPVHYTRSDDELYAGTSTDSSHATINLGAFHLTRWTEDTSREAIRRRACLVNTIAHEWAHTIPAPIAGSLYEDKYHNLSRHPLVSYTIGSIAHCTVLENHGLLRDERFWDCVETVGTRVFRGESQCEQEGDLENVLEGAPR